jgi:hypothetical protein
MEFKRRADLSLPTWMSPVLTSGTAEPLEYRFAYIAGNLKHPRFFRFLQEADAMGGLPSGWADAGYAGMLMVICPARDGEGRTWENAHWTREGIVTGDTREWVWWALSELADLIRPDLEELLDREVRGELAPLFHHGTEPIPPNALTMGWQSCLERIDSEMSAHRSGIR